MEVASKTEGLRGLGEEEKGETKVVGQDGIEVEVAIS